MSLTVAVISDTHSVFRPEVALAIRGCDCVIHAGDFADERTYDTIFGMSIIYAVRGNNDWYIDRMLPKTHRFKLEGLNFFLVHNRMDIPPGLSDVDVVVFGHSHRYFEEVHNGVLWLNPGSCGRRRFGRSELSFAIMKIDGKKYTVEKQVITG